MAIIKKIGLLVQGMTYQHADWVSGELCPVCSSILPSHPAQSPDVVGQDDTDYYLFPCRSLAN